MNWTRNRFIGKEKDAESSLGDFGVRKYEDFSGRFTSPEPLWEKYYGWSPYHYCRNNPLLYIDTKGLDEIHYNKDGTERNRISAGGDDRYYLPNSNGNFNKGVESVYKGLTREQFLEAFIKI